MSNIEWDQTTLLHDTSVTSLSTGYSVQIILYLVVMGENQEHFPRPRVKGPPLRSSIAKPMVDITPDKIRTLLFV